MSCLDVGGTELTCRSTWTIAAVHVWLMQEMAVADVGGVVAVCSWQVRRYVRVCMTVKSCRVSKKRQLSGRSFHTCPRQSLSRRANTIQEVVASLNSRLCLGQERPLSCSFFDASSSLSSPLTNYFFPCSGHYDFTHSPQQVLVARSALSQFTSWAIADLLVQHSINTYVFFPSNYSSLNRVVTK